MHIPVGTTRWITVAITSALLIAIAVGQWWLHEQRVADQRETAVRKAAETTVTAVLSYDYRRLEAGATDTAPLLTDDAKDQYLELQEPLARSAPRSKAIVAAEVKTSTVLESDTNSARVLLFVDQTSSSENLAQPQLDQSRIVVTLKRSGDNWLISTLAAI